MAPAHTPSVHYIHRMSYSTQEKLVGVFILSALALFFMLFFINSQTTHLFEKHINLYLYVNNAEGISGETPVRISGIEVGKVDGVEITADNRILIIVRVYERYQSLLRQDSKAAIGKLSLLGRSSIEISAGSPTLSKLEDGSALLVEEPISLDQLIAEVTPVVTAVGETVQHFATVMLAIEPEKVQGIVDNLLALSQDLQQTGSQVASGQGSLGMVLHDQQFQQDLRQSLNSLATSLQQLEPILDNINKVSQHGDVAASDLPQLMQETRQMVNTINASVGSLSMEIQQLPELITRMNVVMEQTDQLLGVINNSWLFSDKDAPPPSPLIGVEISHE